MKMSVIILNPSNLVNYCGNLCEITNLKATVVFTGKTIGENKSIAHLNSATSDNSIVETVRILPRIVINYVPHLVNAKAISFCNINYLSRRVIVSGLMTMADKAKLYSSLSKEEARQIYLSKSEATNMYLTRASAICNVVESDTGVVFLNGEGEVVFTLPIYGKKKSPQLSVSPNPATIASASNAKTVATITRLGDGELSADGDAEIDGTTITLEKRYADTLGHVDEITITVAETAEYASATAIWRVETIDPKAPTPGDSVEVN